jgi:phosphate transport system substrate-binding protein
VTIRGVAAGLYAMGFLGLAYAEENKGKVKPVAIDNGKGCVLPSRETVLDGSYQPLSRPLFIYVNVKSLERKEVQDFADFYLSPAGPAGPSAARGTLSSPPRPTPSARS